MPARASKRWPRRSGSRGWEVIMPFVDQDVAAQLEGAWVLELVNYAETLKRLGLSPSAATESIGDGVCVYTSPDLPVNRAAGMGLHSPVSARQMQEIERFFLSLIHISEPTRPY